MRSIAVALLVLLSACRGEPVPPDTQNVPSSTHAPASKEETPSAHGMPGPRPEPSTGVEGQTQQPTTPSPLAPSENTAPPAPALPPTAITNTATSSTQPAPATGTRGQ